MRGILCLGAAFALSCAHREPEQSFTATLGATTAGPTRPPAPQRQSPNEAKQTGLATWYGPGLAGKKTSNGERFDPRAMTAAHRKLPFGTWVEVRRVDTGRTVRVRINDRGPWGDARKVIDLSRHAAEMLDMIREGSVRVEIVVVDGPS